MEKTELLESISRSHAAMEALLAALDTVQLTQPGVYGELAIKDVLAHITGWEEMEVGWITASLRGEMVKRFIPGYIMEEDNDHDEVMDRLNERIYQDNKDRPLDAVLADFRAAHERIVALVRGMSEQDLNDPRRFNWWPGEPIWQSIAGNSYEHYQEHQDLIQAWLDNNKSQST